MAIDGGVVVAVAADAADVGTGVESSALFQNPRSIGLVAGGGLICSCRSGCAGNSSISSSLRSAQRNCWYVLDEEWEKEFD
jgi:hypothetical protein